MCLAEPEIILDVDACAKEAVMAVAQTATCLPITSSILFTLLAKCKTFFIVLVHSVIIYLQVFYSNYSNYCRIEPVNEVPMFASS